MARAIRAGLCMCVLVVAGSVMPARAAEPNWGAATADYVVVNQDLRSILNEISSHLSLSAFVSDEIKGRVVERINEPTMRELVEKLGRRYGFTWYYDGGKIYFSSLKENSSVIIPIGRANYPDLRRQLNELGLLDARFELRYSAAGRSVFVSGPPRYVELIRQGVEAANAPIVDPLQGPTVNVIFGRGGH